MVPAPCHFKTAKQVLAAGMHALAGKPPCPGVAECERVLGLIREGIVVGHIERFNPVVTEAARIVRDPL
ncbi:MAG: gfo/Idh/MocA family oxidoreductase, partial [Methanomicrobiales archaeon]|nr:gfo/Idh/MocA family oxidoreductase [Methanomicrobiales archaeon]